MARPNLLIDAPERCGTTVGLWCNASRRRRPDNNPEQRYGKPGEIGGKHSHSMGKAARWYAFLAEINLGKALEGAQRRLYRGLRMALGKGRVGRDLDDSGLLFAASAGAKQVDVVGILIWLCFAIAAVLILFVL